jgi:predicted nucleotidyltransferase
MKISDRPAIAAPMSRVIRGAFPDRRFDVDFWQQQGDEAIFEAAWELVGLAAEIKGSRLEPEARFPDFTKDLLRLFNQHRVRCLIVGGYAVMKYTEPFYTKDMDIWVEPEAENAKRAYRALVEFGAPMADLTADDLTQPHVVFQFGMAPARVDVMTTIDAVTFPEAWKNRVETHLSGIPISIISLQDLIRNKEAASRDSDRLHLKRLREYGG